MTPPPDYTLVHSSGDPVTDALQSAIFHSDGEVTSEMACRIASVLREELFDDDSLEDWGITLSAEVRQ